MIPVFKPYTDGKEIENLKEVIDSRWWGLGPKTKLFEEKIAEYMDIKHAIALNSATAALHLALQVLDIKDKEVITTSMTFVSTNHAILYNQGIPVFADIEEDTLNINPEEVEKLITDKTKAIICVHYGGNPCKMNQLKDIAKRHNLFLVEDVAHGMGGEFEDKKLGTIGDIGCLSFQAVKNLATGDGGMIVTENDEFADRITKLRWVGITKDTFSRDQLGQYSWYYDVVELGYKFHMNDISAAIGLAQLEKLDWMNNQRRLIANNYRKELSGTGDIQFLKENQDGLSSQHNFVIKTKYRDQLNLFLKDQGIATGVHYYPNHFYNMYKPYYRELKVTEDIWSKILTLPLYPDMTEEEFSLIIGNIKNFYSKHEISVSESLSAAGN